MAIQLTQRSKECIMRHALAVLSRQNEGRGAAVDTYNGDDHAYAMHNALVEAGVIFPNDDQRLAFVFELLQRGGKYGAIREALMSPKTVKEVAPTVIDRSLLR